MQRGGPFFKNPRMGVVMFSSVCYNISWTVLCGGEGVKEKIRVVAVDDQRFARMYVDMYISASPKYELAASLPFAEDALVYLRSHPVDLIILDVVMERGVDGLTAAAQIKKEHPEVKIILSTSMSEAGWMERARALGIESFWYKEYSSMPLLEIMDRTINGEKVYENVVPETYLGSLAVSELNDRQKSILAYLVQGMTNKEIAERTYLSANTVKSYLDDIMDASGIHSRTELAVRASKLGLHIGNIE